MNLPKSRHAILAACALAAPIAGLADPIYQNDFATRTSAGAVPSGEWRSVAYAPGRLINASSWSNPFGAASDLQDNWIIGQGSQQDTAFVIDDGGDQEALLCYTQANWAVSSVIAKHRLGNTFTSGVVTAQCDMKAPTDWQAADIRSARLLLGDEAFFNPGTSSDTYLTHLAAGAGISVYAAGNSAAYKFFRYGADLASATTAPKGGATWYRVVMTVDVGTKKYSAAIYDMGAGHPSPDAATPATPAWSETGIDFWSVTKEASFSGISAVAIAGYGVSGTTNEADRAQAAQFDNIRVWHDGALCYENDFTTRRARSFAPASAAAAYPAASTPATNVLAYASGTTILPAINTSLDKQTVGFDGWRRLNNGQNCKIRPTVSAYTNNNAMLIDYAGDAVAYCIASQPLGRTLAGGKVRICADVRQAALTDGGNYELFLGSDAMYSGGGSYVGGIFARVGVSGAKNGTDANGNAMRTPRWGTSTGGAGSGSQIVTSSTGAATAAKWFRMSIVADLDAGTYDYTIHHVRDATGAPAYGTASGEVLFSKTGIARYKAIGEVTSFALSTYYGTTYFDNVCVWHRPAGAVDEELVYSNTFSTRTLYGCGEEDRLVGTLAEGPGGIDGWTRLGTTTDDIFLVGGDNPALGFEDAGTSANYVVHDLGGAYHNGTAVVRFDMLAPSDWNANGGNAYVWLGGAAFREGNLNGGDGNFAKWRVCGAGFARTSLAAFGGDGSGGGAFQTGAATTAGHWYRFVMKSDLTGNGVSDVSVYDMGTEQSTLSMPTPSSGAAATFSNLPFRRPARAVGDISCIGVQFAGAKAASPLKATDYRLLIDNIAVDFNPAAFVMVVR